MDKDRNKINERLLNLTLDIIYLLTGEEYIVVKKSCVSLTLDSSPYVSGGFCRTQRQTTETPPHSLTHERHNVQKILELTSKITQLLTREAGEYLEEHKNMMMENHRSLQSLAGPETRDDLGGLHAPRPLLNSDKPVIQRQRRNGRNMTESTLLREPNSNSPMEHTSGPSSHIKEEPVLCDGGDLTHTDMNTPTDQPQSTSTHIKEEPISCDGGNHKDMYRPTGHTQYTSTHVKEDPVSSEGEKLTNTNICTPVGHTKYMSTLTEEKGNLSCDRRKSTDQIKTQNSSEAKRFSQLVCTECSKCFPSMSGLVAHQGSHIAEKLFQGRNRILTLYPHPPYPPPRRLSPSSPDRKTPPVLHKLLKCSECDRSFYNKMSLNTHRKTHKVKTNHSSNVSLPPSVSRPITAKKPSKCSKCGK